MILAIDTSGSLNQIMIWQAGHFYSSRWQSGKSDTEKLLLQIDKIFRQHQLSPSQIKKIIIYPGPGSYTGLRVGFSLVGVLALANKSEIYAATDKNLRKEIIKLQKNIGLIKNPKPIYQTF